MKLNKKEELKEEQSQNLHSTFGYNNKQQFPQFIEQYN